MIGRDSLFDEPLTSLLGEAADPVAAGWRLRELAESAIGHGPQLVASVAERSAVLAESDPAIIGGLLRVIHTVVLQSGGQAVTDVDPGGIEVIASSLAVKTPNRHLLLQLYAMIRSEASLRLLVRALKAEPPAQWVEAAQVLSPLMQHDDWPVDAIYPEALDCLQHPALAAPLLDLANYVYRTGRVEQHPAADRLATLNLLLGEVSGRLGQFRGKSASLRR